jgi:hypothetical protein
MAQLDSHRGINISSIAQEGLSGLPGVLIAVFFGVAGIYFLLGFFVGGFVQFVGIPVVIIFLLAEGGACVAYILGRRRDRRLAAEVDEAFRGLAASQGSPRRTDGSAATAEATAPKSEEAILADVRMVEAQAEREVQRLSLEGILVGTVALSFLFAMIYTLLPLKYEGLFMAGAAALLGGVGIGSIFLRARRRQRAGLDARNRT